MTNITTQDTFISGSELENEVQELRDDIENKEYESNCYKEAIEDLDAEDDAKDIEMLEQDIQDLETDITCTQEDLAPLASFFEDVESSGMSMNDITLIREDYFQEYCESFAHDCGEISRDSSIYAYVDWEAYADAMLINYITVSFDGQDYYHRA